METPVASGIGPLSTYVARLTRRSGKVYILDCSDLKGYVGSAYGEENIPGPVVADLQVIYRAATAAEAEQHLAELEAKWKAYPSVSQVWRRNWARVTPFFNYPQDIRTAVYTTNST